jgi:hypothetical protein
MSIDGKEGVIGSSPMEGLEKVLQTALFGGTNCVSVAQMGRA